MVASKVVIIYQVLVLQNSNNYVLGDRCGEELRNARAHFELVRRQALYAG